MLEIWKDIPGYEGKYQASDQGHIRSLTRSITKLGRWGKDFTRVIQGRVLRPACTKENPHLYVMLGHGANGSQVHQLVARAFLGPQPPHTDVRHLDGDPKNNAPSNLCYGTRTENILDVLRIGRAWRKLTTAQAVEIRARRDAGEKVQTLADEYGVSAATVSSICKGWTHRCCT